MKELFSSSFELSRLLLSRLAGWLNEHSTAVRWAFLAAIISALVWIGYQRAITRHITIFSGPPAGTGAKDAKRLAAEFEGSSRIYKEMFTVNIHATAGFEENRKLISEDQLGTSLAFAHDGFAPSDGVRVLLPLEYNYLHIICHNDFLKKVRSANLDDNSQSSLDGDKSDFFTFDDVVPLLEKEGHGRVYFGPKESGTRQMATMVVEKFQLSVNSLSSYNWGSFDDMRIALLRGDIDVAFYCGPIRAQIVNEIARDGRTELIGLTPETRKALLKNRDHLHKVEFPANSYNLKFSRHELPTIASRRVIICSSQMGERLAYRLASLAYDTLRDDFPELQWKRVEPEPQSKNLAYRIHPGAERFREKDHPRLFSPQVLTFLAIFMSWVLTELFRGLTRGLERPAGSSPPTTPDDGETPVPAPRSPSRDGDTFRAFQQEIEVLARRLPEPDEPLRATQRGSWTRRIRVLLNNIRQAREAGSLSEKEFESLIVGVEMELDGRLASSGTEQHSNAPEASTR